MTRGAPRPSRARRWLLASTLLGLAASSYATWVHYHLLSNPAYTSYCDVSSTVNCTQAYLSRFGSLGGVPVALLGTLFFTLVLVLLVVPRGAGTRENVPAYLFALSTVGLALVMYLAYGSFVVLKTVCPICVATYVAVVGLFLISGGAMSFSMSQLPARAARDLHALASSPLALTVALLFLAGAASAVAFFPRDVTLAASDGQSTSATPAQSPSTPQTLSSQEQAQFEQWYAQFPIVDPGVPTEGASVLIVKFNDYQCPPCKQTYEGFKSILAKYRASHPGQVRFVTKDFPLDPECNFNAPGGAHLAACEAAVAVRLAEAKNRREAMEDWLFANQSIMTPELVRQGVRQVAGVTDFDAQYPRVLQQVKADVASAGALNVRSTPTFFINARMIRGGFAPRALDVAIAYELKRAAAR